MRSGGARGSCSFVDYFVLLRSLYLMTVKIFSYTHYIIIIIKKKPVSRPLIPVQGKIQKQRLVQGLRSHEKYRSEFLLVESFL